MFEIYSNLRSCIEDVDRTGNLDACLALFILEHHDEIPDMSIRELANSCSTSPASVSRFCRRVNDSDYRELKDQMVEYNAWLRTEASDNRASQSIDVAWYFDIMESALYQTRALLTEDILDRAVDWISGANNIYLYGSSFSNIIAREASEKLNRINRQSYSFSSVKGQLASLDLLREDDVVILISFSGKTQHVIRLYMAAKLAGCRIIWISANSDLGRVWSKSEMLLPVSSVSCPEYRTALVESMSLRCAIDAVYISYTNRLRAPSR